jgi:hypothetical protein
MGAGIAYKHLVAASRQRGLPGVGFLLEAPPSLELVAVARGPSVLTIRERESYVIVGELDISLFAAALVIDRDGILAEKAEAVAAKSGGKAYPAVAVALPGASGYRARAELGAGELPYLFVVALAASDAAGAMLITMRSARPAWPAGEAVLDSLRLLDRRGNVRAPTDEALRLPLSVGGDRES